MDFWCNCNSINYNHGVLHYFCCKAKKGGKINKKTREFLKKFQTAPDEVKHEEVKIQKEIKQEESETTIQKQLQQPELTQTNILKETEQQKLKTCQNLEENCAITVF